MGAYVHDAILVTSDDGLEAGALGAVMGVKSAGAPVQTMAQQLLCQLRLAKAHGIPSCCRAVMRNLRV